jgi:hypothetical protein
MRLLSLLFNGLKACGAYDMRTPDNEMRGVDAPARLAFCNVPIKLDSVEGAGTVAGGMSYFTPYVFNAVAAGVTVSAEGGGINTYGMVPNALVDPAANLRAIGGRTTL